MVCLKLPNNIATIHNLIPFFLIAKHVFSRPVTLQMSHPIRRQSTHSTWKCNISGQQTRNISKHGAIKGTLCIRSSICAKPKRALRCGFMWLWFKPWVPKCPNEIVDSHAFPVQTMKTSASLGLIWTMIAIFLWRIQATDRSIASLSAFSRNSKASASPGSQDSATKGLSCWGETCWNPKQFLNDRFCHRTKSLYLPSWGTDA